MNKIVLDKEEVIVVDEDLDVVVSSGMVKEVYLCAQNKNVSINYQVAKDAHLVVHHYSIDSSFQISIHLDGENASVQYFYSTINEENHDFHLELFHNASKTESDVVCHGVNAKDQSLLFDIYPYVLKQSKLCVCNQENNIINLSEGQSVIRPNLLIDCYDVISSHSAYIGSFRDDFVFYLMSRGLSREASYEILMKSFLVRDVVKLEKVFPKFLEKLKKL